MYKHNLKLIVAIWLFCSTISVNAETRIMPLGDSITYDSRYGETRSTSVRTGYRSHLWYQLQDVNFEANFVGSKKAGEAIEPAFDPDNEGHPGWNQYEIAEETYAYMDKSKPNIVLLHIGTNDRGTTNPQGIEDILNTINLYESENNQEIRVYVALIIDRKDKDGRIEIFNRRLSQLLYERITKEEDNISIVDMYNNARLEDSDYADATHPNDKGYKKMANVWFKALTLPFNPTLSAFPYSILSPTNIISTAIDSKGKTIKITTTVPNAGIRF